MPISSGEHGTYRDVIVFSEAQPVVVKARIKMIALKRITGFSRESQNNIELKNLRPNVAVVALT